MRFLIVDGYPKESRDEFGRVGMRLAGVLYSDLLHRYLPEAEAEVWYSSDNHRDTPAADELRAYDGLLWPGCNLTVYHDDARVHKHLELCRRAFGAGLPQFGSCYAIQLAVQVAGGVVSAHPKGREMGVNHGIRLTPEGVRHPMYEGKPPVFAHLHSHDDEIKALPPQGATLLAFNDWCVQAAEICHANGVFWATQYHPEYDLGEMAALIRAREARLIKQGMFADHGDVEAYCARLEALHRDPARKDLRWQLKIGDDIVDDALRTLEFRNWLRHQARAAV